MKRLLWLLFLVGSAFAQLELAPDSSFHTQGLDVMFDTDDGQRGGIQVVLHDQLVAAFGNLRLETVTGPWAPQSKIIEKKLHPRQNRLSLVGSYEALDLNYTLNIQAVGTVIHVSVDLDRALPFQWAGKVGFNLEFNPEIFIDKSWILDNEQGLFSAQPAGLVKPGANSHPNLVPLATGKTLDVATEDAQAHFTVHSRGSDLQLFDGRLIHNDGWFVLRSLVPTGASRNAVEWVITPTVQSDFKHATTILHNRVGYLTRQPKHAVIRMDESQRLGRAFLVRLDSERNATIVFTDRLKRQSEQNGLEYAVFDFTRVQNSGLYQIRYQDQVSTPFEISPALYENQVWLPILSQFFPSQMCHMRVQYRNHLVHGACHLDDALQAPPYHDHFAGFQQGATTTPLQPFESIAGLNQGGWHAGGRYFLATAEQALAVYYLACAAEQFNIETDQTTINRKTRQVELFSPDGKPDILQQIEHGARFLLASYQSLNHSIIGIAAPTPEQYSHIGDASLSTDNQKYAAGPENPSLSFLPNSMDDRWAYTDPDAGLEYRVSASLAAAGRALSTFNDSLAAACLQRAERIWQMQPAANAADSVHTPAHPEAEKIRAAVELFKSTQNAIYRDYLLTLEWTPKLFKSTGWLLVQIDHMLDNEDFSKALVRHLKAYAAELKKESKSTPYQLPVADLSNWRVTLLQTAVQHAYLAKHQPEIFNLSPVFNIVNFALGGAPGGHSDDQMGIGSGSFSDICDNPATPQKTNPHYETRMSDAAAFILMIQMLQN